MGKGGSGKDFLRRKLENRGYVYQVSYTTRPAREGEVDGRDYWFIDEKQALEMEEKHEWFHVVSFNNFKYGTTQAQFYNSRAVSPARKESASHLGNSSASSVFIMTPLAVQRLSENDRKQSFIIYLNPPQNVIEERLQQRKMSKEALYKRVQADIEEFKDFKDYDIQISNPDF